ncbi:restriction endonuclease subunit S [uncultured Desulfovibrio sp.]|uniref:restriction endonuclease subunit S n=1 Tax=uncultured Desulfovibrio sp. TaxID=167968 RepID=UPI0026092138|nr:restriction endonuclease subunit S [uncultured Desulfovibrio sp.]
MNARQLKNAILQQAIEGRLVPQHPDDEPAAVLLERIRAEKARLVAAGKVRKQKPLPPVSEEEKPFALPNGWEWVRLGEVSRSIHYGFTASATPVGNVKLLRITDIQGDFVDWDAVPFCSVSNDKISNYILDEGDILIARTGGTIGKSFLIDKVVQTAIFASYLIRVTLCDAVSPFFIKYFLGSQLYWNQLMAASMGTGQPNVNGTALAKLYLPLPPLAEQKRIVAKLEELLPDVEAYGQAQEALDALEAALPERLRKSLLQEAMQGRLVPQHPDDEPAAVLLERIRAEKARLVAAGKVRKQKPLPPVSEAEKPFALPNGWEWVRLGEVALYGSGRTVKEGEVVSGWLLELEDIEKDTGNILIRRHIDAKKLGSTKNIFKKGNVLYSKLRPNLNKAVLADCDGYCSSEIIPIDFGKDVYPNFAHLFLLSTFFVEYATKKAYGVKMPRLGTDDAKKALFPLPPLAEQKRIVAKLEELLPLCRGEAQDA